jgi:hypothetical protein
MNAITKPEPALPEVHVGGSIFDNSDLFGHQQRVAKLFAASALIPQHLRGNNGADAFLAIQIARRMNEDPVMVMQNIYVVHGRAGFAASYMIARANRSGVFKGPIRWRSKGAGETLEVTAYATLAATGEDVDSTVGMAMAKAEKWTSNPKYSTMPEHMLRYRSATFLVRLYCPEVMLGMQTQEELFDMAAAGEMRDITPPQGARPTASEALARIAADEPVTESADAPVADASAGGGDTSQPSPPQPEAPALDFGGPPATEPMSEEDLDMAAQALTRQFASFKRPAAIDNYLATDKREVMERIEAQAPDLAKFIRSKADAAKKALVR